MAMYCHSGSCLLFLYTRKSGKVSELRERFGDDVARRMEAMGYILTSHCKRETRGV